MSVACCIPLIECVYCLACVRWGWKKFLYTAGRESEEWGLATATEFEPIQRICKYVNAVYEDDLRNPVWEPPGGGLSIFKNSDFFLLFDNKLGQTKFDNGYVHNGLLKAAEWVFEEECGVLRELVEENPSYALTFIGHSLGAGIVACLTMLAVVNREKLGGIEMNKIRCFAISPTRCVSLNLAMRYADVINSIVLQDDFLPRTTVALETAFKSLFCLGSISPVVRTAVPVDGRFEHIVLSCNMTQDHRILRISGESERALSFLEERDKSMERKESITKEHMVEYRAALRRAVSLDVPAPPSRVERIRAASPDIVFTSLDTMAKFEGFLILKASQEC
ncbi:hydrolase [Lithospermum erythrorhizon]|uniref:Hydrolase n=1 Tax=Lithospermum erythrorhizon TaxID=34254 RepID=A0AAV3P0H8_LITER